MDIDKVCKCSNAIARVHPVLPRDFELSCNTSLPIDKTIGGDNPADQDPVRMDVERFTYGESAILAIDIQLDQPEEICNLRRIEDIIGGCCGIGRCTPDAPISSCIVWAEVFHCL